MQSFVYSHVFGYKTIWKIFLSDQNPIKIIEQLLFENVHLKWTATQESRNTFTTQKHKDNQLQSPNHPCELSDISYFSIMFIYKKQLLEIIWLIDITQLEIWYT